MIARVRRAGVLGVLVVAAVAVGAALAAPGDPQKKLTKADQARARAASIRLADLGAGWKSVPSGNKDSGNPRCSNYNPDQSDLVETGDYDSPDFTRTDGSFVSSTTGVFRTAQMARTGYGRVAVPALASCFAELFQKQAVKPNTIQILGTGPLAFPALGDRSAAYRVTMTYKTRKASVPFTTDLVVFDKGRTDVALIFLGIAQPLPAAAERALAARVVSRVR